jgi:hypothetical protein
VIWKRIESIANWRTFLVLIVLTAGFVVFFNRIGAHYPKGGTLDGRNKGYRVSEVPTILGQFALAGQLKTYLKQEYVDLFFPLVYTLLLAVPIVGLGKSLPVPHALVLLPFLGGLADWVENACIIRMIRQYQVDHTVSQKIAAIASGASALKLAALTVSVTIVILLAILRAFRGRT